MNNIIDADVVRSAVNKRKKDDNKNTVGSLLSICGSYGMTGAAVMSAKASLRSGIGLLKIAAPKSVYPIMAQAIPQAVFYPVEDGKIGEFDFCEKSRYCNGLLVGCGLSVNSNTTRLVRRITEGSSLPMVLDADALNIISAEPEILLRAKAEAVLTPHRREFSRLINRDIQDVNSEPERLAREFAVKYRVVLVLKDAVTLVASPDGELMLNADAGNPGMACGGSGDVLAGIIASLIAQGAKPFEGACAGVYLHALAGDLAKERFGEISMLPTDIIDCLPQAFKSCGF